MRNKIGSFPHRDGRAHISIVLTDREFTEHHPKIMHFSLCGKNGPNLATSAWTNERLRKNGISLRDVFSLLKGLSQSWSTHPENILFYFALHLLQTCKLFWYHSLAWAERSFCKKEFLWGPLNIVFNLFHLIFILGIPRGIFMYESACTNEAWNNCILGK